MRWKIRPGTFETASSAIHSMIVDPDGDGMEKSKLKPDKKTGKVKVPITYLGREQTRYTTQLEKLSFLLTCLWCIGDLRSYRTDDYDESSSMYDDYRFKIINNAVKDYCGMELSISIPRKPTEIGADHQIYNELDYGELPYINLYDEKAIQKFIFDKYIVVETGSD